MLVPAARFIIAALVTFALCLPATADSWMAPTTQKVKSANGKYVATLVPVEIGRRAKASAPRPHVTVRAADALDGAPPLWEADLTNDVSPVELMVSDDGRHVVTFDNWGHMGYGDDTVAIYERDKAGGRQVARFATDQILTPDELAAAPRSTSSLHWRQDSYICFDSAGEAAAMCLWLGKPGRWVAWDLSTGKPIDPATSPQALARWKKKGADWAARELSREDGDRSGPMRYLSLTKDPRTPDLIEKHLRADDFMTVRERWSDGSNPLWLVWSRTRKAADRALATFHGDPKPVKPDPMASKLPFMNTREPDWEYVRLGALVATVQVADAPGAEAADLFVYLIPESAGREDWHAARPVHALRARPDAPVQSVHVRFQGVTPGRYWLKAVYDSGAPFQDPSWGKPTPVCRPGAGDRESNERLMIDVKVGATASCGTLRCTPVVK